MQPTTLCLLIKDDKVLLAMKKRGFGVGKWNGIGGKVKEGETVKAAAVRETGEEIKVVVDPANMEQVGCIDFNFKDKSDWNQQMHIFLIKNWNGEPKESEEMMPKWYSHDEIPFDEMWLDDKYWLPLVLAGKKVEGKFYFINEGAQIDGFDIREI
ncbi:MAG: 8-oxo-dGTP diphosphatase [Candidatus Yanofskybacteria bacterium]|nr:8-oxo-dGTP diphosphatase [Candidatus Yanofskybacteria bacterium]